MIESLFFELTIYDRANEKLSCQGISYFILSRGLIELIFMTKCFLARVRSCHVVC